MAPRPRGPAAAARVLLVGFGVVAGVAVARWALAGTAPVDKGFQETAAVVSVEVPVTVVRGDQPVRGLSAADFELYDGKRRQPISGFEVVDLASSAGSGGADSLGPARVPIAGRRHFLLLFDLSYSEPSSIVKARRAAGDFVAKGVHPSDLVAVATYSTLDGPRLVLGFTSDRRQVAYAIGTLGLAKLGERNPDQLGVLIAPDAGPGGHNPLIESRKKNAEDYYFLEALQDLARPEAAAARQGQKADVTSMTQSLAGLARLMASVQGRKYVVYLSSGFDSGLIRGATDRDTVKDLTEAAATMERQRVDSSLRFGDTKTSTEVNRMLEEFRRADCVIESVDIGGIRAAADQNAHNDSGEDSLFLMARDTGGELFRNTNDLFAAMTSLLERTSVTYILSFQPSELGPDGSYHELKVKLRDERTYRGARVVYRPGYYAPRPYLAVSPLERQLATAGLLLGGAPGGRISTSVLAAPLPVAGGPAYVPVVIEIDGPALLAGATDTAQADVYAYALDEQGTIHDHFGQIVELDLAKVRGTVEKGGVRLYGHLDLDPGRYVLRVLVRNGVTGETGLRVVPLVVPAFGQGEPALLPPLIANAPGRWLTLRESGHAEERRVPFPFTAGGQPFVPSARPTLAADSETQLLLMETGFGAGDLALAGRVLGADGRVRGQGSVALRGRAVGSGNAGGAGGAGVERLLATFRPGSLPAGDYTLVITLSDPATRRELSSSLPFAVAAAPAPPPDVKRP